MPSTLSVRDEKRSRSKSPAGRTHDRSRSRDPPRAKSPPRKDRRRSKYSESESEESDDSDRRPRRSSKKYYDESDDDRRRRTSKKYSESESEEDNRHEKASKSKKRYEDDNDYKIDRRGGKRDSKPRRRDESESDSDRKKDRGKKPSRRKDKDSGSSGSEDIKISIHKSHKDKDNKGGRENGRLPSQVSVPPAYPYGPPGYPPGYPTDPRLAYQDTRHASYSGVVPVGDPRYDPNIYPGRPQVPEPHRTHSYSGQGGRYAEPDRYQYAQVDPNLRYRGKDEKTDKQYIKTYDAKGHQQLVEIQPSATSKHAKDEKKSREDKYGRHEKKYHNDKYGSPPEDSMVKKMSHLAVGGALGAATLGVAGRHNSHDGGRPPASPMLEAYKGTYQSISPMPGALVLATHDSDISDMEGLDSDSDSSESEKDELKRKIKKLEKEKKKFQKNHNRDEKEIALLERSSRDRKVSDASVLMVSPSVSKKRVSFYDPVADAKKIAAALQGSHVPVNTKPLAAILPWLSTDDLFALRAEYKNHAKVAGQGINMAKHIKMRIPANLGKVCYATALGRWESEAYFANSYYFSGNVRRELLIESLMGRPNGDIREIKRVFKDKRYDDDLVKCMKAELKADKFRTAILLALEERRALENEGLEIDTVQRDVTNLHRALMAKSESAMIEIIVVRSDAHLREVLRLFEAKYEINFARQMISQSRNLVVSTPCSTQQTRDTKSSSLTSST